MQQEIYLHKDNQMGLNFSEALTNPDKFNKDLNKKLVIALGSTAVFFVFLNMLVFKRRG